MTLARVVRGRGVLAGTLWPIDLARVPRIDEGRVAWGSNTRYHLEGPVLLVDERGDQGRRDISPGEGDPSAELCTETSARPEGAIVATVRVSRVVVGPEPWGDHSDREVVLLEGWEGQALPGALLGLAEGETGGGRCRPEQARLEWWDPGHCTSPGQRSRP